MGNPAPISRQNALLRDQGIDWLTAAGELGIGIQYAEATLSGSAPHALTFAALTNPSSGKGLQDMADANYQVHVSGLSAAVLDHATRTVTGFSLNSGSASDVVLLLIVGRLKNQTR